MILLEAEVHSLLRGLLRQQEQPVWNHYLTMARLVSRALRLQGSALIQTGSTASRYALSYLTPALLSQSPVLLVVPTTIQQRLFAVEIPQLREWLKVEREIQFGSILGTDGYFNPFDRLTVISPQVWLADRLENQNYFPKNIPILIDQADDLEEWTRDYLTVTITARDWELLQQNCPDYTDKIREFRIQLTKIIFSHPQNPYECCLIETEEQENLQQLLAELDTDGLLIAPFDLFWSRLQTENQLLSATINRETGQFYLSLIPIEVKSILSPLWQESTVVFMGGFLDADKAALTYRNAIGLTADILCLSFAPNRQNEYIQLYLPERLPMPNNPKFQGVLLEQVHTLVSLCSHINKPVVILIEDVPLKAQVGTKLAAEWGSKVQVEKLEIVAGGILICDWDFWHQYQDQFPTPQLLIIATLPIPSLENPLVAGRVAYYKRQRRDWFRLYLLPTALRAIQRAVMPLRESQGVVALLDNRASYRSYGNQILSALEPYARINYIDMTWFR